MGIDYSDVNALLEEWEGFNGDDVSVFIEHWTVRLNDLARA